jgi:predicted transcriptional regulator
MNILVIDAQGGGIGKQLVSAIKQNVSDASVTAVGTNSAATAAMLKAGADIAATGENAVIVGCRKADVILGPIGIVIADSLYGEVTEKMAAAVGQSSAKRILIPINHCGNIIAGVTDLSLGKLVQSAIEELVNVKNNA